MSSNVNVDKYKVKIERMLYFSIEKYDIMFELGL